MPAEAPRPRRGILHGRQKPGAPLAQQQPVTAAQMGVTPDDTGYFSILINNGRIIDKNLKRMGRDERWLQKQLQQRGAQSVRDVYLLMLNDAGQIYFSAKEPI